MSDVGRPSSYMAKYADQAYKLCLLGLTDVELADVIGVNIDTLHAWKHRHPEFSDSIQRGKAVADGNVAERLYQRALGYSHEAVKIFMPAGADQPVYADYTEHYPPDTQAASLWLRNRQPEKWRDRHELTGAGGKDLIPERAADPERVAHAVLLLLQSAAPRREVPAIEAWPELKASEDGSKD